MELICDFTPTKPTTVNKSTNSITFSWESCVKPLLKVLHDKELVYTLELKNHVGEWKLIYWGFKLSFQVESLEPLTCHKFRFRVGLEKIHSAWSEVFKEYTTEEPYRVAHLERALRISKIKYVKDILKSRKILKELENRTCKIPLQQVTEDGNLEMAMLLLNMGTKVNGCNRFNKRTPLMSAIVYDQIEIARFLVRKGAKVDLRDVIGRTVLHYAVESDSVENVRLILEQKPEIDAKDTKGWTPLARGVMMGVKEAVIRLLLDHGADPSVKDDNGVDCTSHARLINHAGLVDLLSTAHNNTE